MPHVIFGLLLFTLISMIILKVVPERVINVGDYVSIALALISLAGVTITYSSVKRIGEQVDIQKQQFNLEKRPLFKITHYESYGKNYVVIKEETGNYYHLGEYMTRHATDTNAEVYLELYGSVNGSEKGLVFYLENNRYSNYACNISLFVTDILGNEYRYETPSFAIHDNLFSELGHDLTGEFLKITKI